MTCTVHQMTVHTETRGGLSTERAVVEWSLQHIERRPRKRGTRAITRTDQGTSCRKSWSDVTRRPPANVMKSQNC